MTTSMRRQTPNAYEKAARLTPDHPRRRHLNSPVRHRVVRSSWGSTNQKPEHCCVQDLNLKRTSPRQKLIIPLSKTLGVELTSPYEDEKAAQLLTLDWAWANCPTERISICSDSQSLRPLTRSGSRPYVSAVQVGASNTRTVAAEDVGKHDQGRPGTSLWTTNFRSRPIEKALRESPQ